MSSKAHGSVSIYIMLSSTRPRGYKGDEGWGWGWRQGSEYWGAGQRGRGGKLFTGCKRLRHTHTHSHTLSTCQKITFLILKENVDGLLGGIRYVGPPMFAPPPPSKIIGRGGSCPRPRPTPLLFQHFHAQLN